VVEGPLVGGGVARGERHEGLIRRWVRLEDRGIEGGEGGEKWVAIVGGRCQEEDAVKMGDGGATLPYYSCDRRSFP
jgi:hypothetical protein